MHLITLTKFLIELILLLIYCINLIQHINFFFYFILYLKIYRPLAKTNLIFALVGIGANLLW